MPDRALLQARRRPAVSSVQLGAGGRAVLGADDQHPQRALRDQVRRVARRCPGRAGPGTRRRWTSRSRSRPVRRSSRRSGAGARSRVGSSTGANDRPSWPSTSQRDALADLRRVVRVRQDLQVGVGVHVDEAGRQHQPVRVDRPRGRAGRSLPIATMRPPSTATSASTPGAPVPSRTVAPRDQQVGHAQKKVRTRSTTTGSAASGSSTTGISPHLSNAVHGWERPTGARRRSTDRVAVEVQVSRAGRSAW